MIVKLMGCFSGVETETAMVSYFENDLYPVMVTHLFDGECKNDPADQPAGVTIHAQLYKESLRRARSIFTTLVCIVTSH